MLRLPCLALLAGLCLATSGCAQALAPAHVGPPSVTTLVPSIPSIATIAVTGLIVAASAPNADERARQQEQDDATAARADDRPYAYRDTNELLGSPAAPPMHADELDRTLDIGALRASMSKVDLARCRDAGAPRGYGHAHITIEPEGVMSKILIDGPHGMPPAAIQCVGHALADVEVPEYRGEQTTFGVTWFVP